MVTRFSTSFIPTKKEAPKDATSLNQKLLTRAGFVHQELAGVYTMLPLGLRVLRKIENIIRKHMESLGGQEILMPALEPKANWLTTSRWNNFDVLFKVKSQHGYEYALGPTHEEIVIPLAKERAKSYKDLPFSLYQIQTKFRDEPRAKSGLMRGREFGMKDLYSFHESKEDLGFFYEKAKRVYIALFKEMGLDAKITEASGGDFTKKFSHEFMVLSDAGEDNILACSTCSFAQNAEIAKVKAGDSCPNCKGVIEEKKAVEAGNIFDLSTKFSEDFELTYVDKNGKKQFVVVGCYGIGTSRLVGTIAEVCADAKGLVWPESVSPYDYHVVVLDAEEKPVATQLQKLLSHLEKKQKDVLVDDREERAGMKFADADLIGIPHRIVVSSKTAASGKVEIKSRLSEKGSFTEIKDI
jgi:prolyl-tRNA synthetase